ncbi:MAG: type II secretion system protein N [Candidatus Ratteibacteria bacterium]|nr:type II secretion system protein N [Candidatus Ratteibacteria bacterium]
MAQDKSTPEKRLLELIESPSERTIREIKKKRIRNSFFSISAIRGKFSFLKQHAGSNLSRHKFALDIRQINIILVFCAVGLATYLVMSWLNASNKLDDVSNLKTEFKTNGQVKSYLPASFLRDISYYSQRVNMRNIFKLDLEANNPHEKEGDVKAEEVVTVKDELAKIMEQLILVGVSWSDNPVAMIENTNAKMTYFLKNGEEIVNGVIIKQIFIDRVILEYKGAEAELKL